MYSEYIYIFLGMEIVEKRLSLGLHTSGRLFNESKYLSWYNHGAQYIYIYVKKILTRDFLRGVQRGKLAMTSLREQSWGIFHRKMAVTISGICSYSTILKIY
jgi:hypothetical protein